VELTASRNGVLLIDEIDNGLHHSVMPNLWTILDQLVEKHQVQVFGTTHNDDMMRSALEAFAGREGMLGLFRIDKRGDRHVMVSYSEDWPSRSSAACQSRIGLRSKARQS